MLRKSATAMLDFLVILLGLFMIFTIVACGIWMLGQLFPAR